MLKRNVFIRIRIIATARLLGGAASPCLVAIGGRLRRRFEELEVGDDDFEPTALLSGGLVLPLVELELPLNVDRGARFEILLDVLRRRVERDAFHEHRGIRLLPGITLLGREGTVVCDGKRAYGGAFRGNAQLGVTGEAPGDLNAIQVHGCMLCLWFGGNGRGMAGLSWLRSGSSGCCQSFKLRWNTPQARSETGFFRSSQWHEKEMLMLSQQSRRPVWLMTRCPAQMRGRMSLVNHSPVGE